MRSRAYTAALQQRRRFSLLRADEIESYLEVHTLLDKATRDLILNSLRLNRLLADSLNTRIQQLQRRYYAQH